MRTPSRTRKEVLKSTVEEYASRILPFLEAVTKLSCPECGLRTMVLEHVAYSGVKVHCTGYDPESEDGTCGFFCVQQLIPESELPHVVKSGEEGNDATRSQEK